MVSLYSISKIYQGRQKVLDRVHLNLAKGEFLYLLGGSGAGKTTLLRLMATEDVPSEGAISLFGYDLSRVSSTTLRAIRQSIGYIPQNHRLIPDLSVYENVALSLSLSGRRVLGTSAKAKIEEVLERLSLREKKEKLCQSLSGGEAQRVAVARALVRSPELLIADEPTGAQDRDNTWSLMDLFVKANVKGCTVVVATHEREIVRRVQKRCAILRNGGIKLEENLCFY